MKVWPKPFHNLRASCETDLMQEHPIHVVTAWLGNTPKIALSHYLQTQANDFEMAIRGKPNCGTESGTVRSEPERSGTDTTSGKCWKKRGKVGFWSLVSTCGRCDKYARWESNPQPVA